MASTKKIEKKQLPETGVEPVLEISAVSPAMVVPVVAAVSPKYRVKSNCKASFFGQAIKLRKDDVIDSSGYGGADGIKRLIDSGADIEEVK